MNAPAQLSEREGTNPAAPAHALRFAFDGAEILTQSARPHAVFDASGAMNVNEGKHKRIETKCQGFNQRARVGVVTQFKARTSPFRLPNLRTCVTLLAIFPVKRSLLFVLALAPFGAVAVQAAPGLGFNVSAKFGAGARGGVPPQVVQAHVLLSGKRARIETSSGGARAIVLYSPPYIYRLLPSDKAGVRWKLSQTQGGGIGGFDVQQLLRNPSQIRASLLQNGAKLTGKSQIGGVPVDVFEMSRPGGRVSHIRAFLRRADSLPMRFEAQSGGLNVVATWSRYARLSNVSPSQFAPPKGYAIRQSQNPPALPML